MLNMSDSSDKITAQDPIRFQGSILENKSQKIKMEYEISPNELKRIKVYDKNTVGFRWRVPTLLQEKRVKSPKFSVNNYDWRVVLRSNVTNYEEPFVSAFLEVYNHNLIEKTFVRFAKFMFRLVNLKDEKNSIDRHTSKRFNFYEPDWGFREFFLRKNVEPDRVNGDFLFDDGSFLIDVIVSVSTDKYLVDPLNYDSKKETGFVGIKNQGCTCYLNSLLQTLFHITEFRKQVYSIPVENLNEIGLVLALQKVFYSLQFGNNAVDTRELTTSFGWTTMDSFMQHDIQELTDVLFDRLEKRNDKLTEFCKGKSRGYIKCTNVPFQSHRDDVFTSICLNVKEMGNIMNSFKHYCEEELLTGENQYNTGHPEFKYQDAKRGIVFQKFPKMLMILLKRYDFNYMTGEQVKINDRFEYSEEIDLNQFVGEDFKGDPDENKFVLFSVLVHSGDISGGHYYAVIKIGGREWYKFDDEKVYRVKASNAIEENFGGNTRDGLSDFWKGGDVGKYTNAYVLYYLKKSEARKMISMMGKSEMDWGIQNYLKSCYLEDLRERERKDREKKEAYLNVSIRLCTLSEIGNSQTSDLVDLEKIRAISVRKSMTVKDFREEVAKKLNLEVNKQRRFWRFVERRNRTYRPSEVAIDEKTRNDSKLVDVFGLSVDEEGSSVDVFVEEKQQYVLKKKHSEGNDDVKFTSDSILLFFRFYSPGKKRVANTGCYVVNSSWNLKQISPILELFVKGDELYGSVPEIQKKKPFKFVCYEEVNQYKPLILDEMEGLSKQKIGSGDIIVYQKRLTRKQKPLYDYPDIPDFYMYIKHRVNVTFKNKTNFAFQFTVEMCKLDDFNKVRNVCAEYLRKNGTQCSGENIKLTGHNPYFGTVMEESFKLRNSPNLGEMLFDPIVKMKSNILYFEVLHESLKEYEKKKKFTVYYYKNGKFTGEAHHCTYNLDQPLSLVFKDLRKTFNIPENVPVRMMECFASHMARRVNEEKNVKTIQRNSKTVLRLEVIPVDQREKNYDNEKEAIIQVIHFDSDSSSVRYFGNPFFLKIQKDEVLSSIREKMKDYLHEEVDVKKVQVVPICGQSRFTLFKEDDVVFKEMKRLHDLYRFEIYLGLLHRDKSKTPSSKNEGSWFHQGIKIKDIKK